LRDKPSLQDLLEVQKRFELPSPVLVEKDWYVVTALAAINVADVKPFRLVFSGGTAFSKAHRLIRRMSEDIDLKIVSDQPGSRPELQDGLQNDGFSEVGCEPNLSAFSEFALGNCTILNAS
jgi:hypothetical protein